MRFLGSTGVLFMFWQTVDNIVYFTILAVLYI